MYMCRVYFPVFQREFNTARIYDFNEKCEKKTLCEINAVYSNPTILSRDNI